MSIIGICGYARVGKDTMAAYFVSRGYEQRSFADGVRQVARRDFQWRHLVDTYGYETAKQKHPYVRQKLIEIGQVARAVCPDIWIRIAFGDPVPDQFADIEQRDAIRGPTVFSDVRNANEAARIHVAGGKIILLTRAGIGPLNDAEREIEQIVPDVTVKNDGTIGDLWGAAAIILSDE